MLKISLAFVIFASLISPAFAQDNIYLETTSDQGTFKIEMQWTPAEIDRYNTFVLKFMDSDTGKEIQDVRYDLLLHSETQQELRRVDQTSTVQEIRFSEPGSYVIEISDIEGLGENATIPIKVTPEFPSGIVLAFVAGMAVISAFRLKKQQ